MTTTKVAAWAWSVSEKDIDQGREAFPGLRLIHYPRTYEHANHGDIAYVDNATSAFQATYHSQKWSHAILSDERNGNPGDEGPSGKYETPEAYIERMGEAMGILYEAGIPFSLKGLSMPGTNFDHQYFEAMIMEYATAVRPTLDGYIPRHGVNGRLYSFDQMYTAIKIYHDLDWTATLIPLRPTWWPIKYNTILAWIRERIEGPSFYRALTKLNERPNVRTIGIWCLKEGMLGDGHWQSWHGLLNRDGQVTRQGRTLQRWLKENA